MIVRGSAFSDLCHQQASHTITCTSSNRVSLVASFCQFCTPPTPSQHPQTLKVFFEVTAGREAHLPTLSSSTPSSLSTASRRPKVGDLLPALEHIQAEGPLAISTLSTGPINAPSNQISSEPALTATCPHVRQLFSGSPLASPCYTQRTTCRHCFPGSSPTLNLADRYKSHLAVQASGSQDSVF